MYHCPGCGHQISALLLHARLKLTDPALMALCGLASFYFGSRG